MSSSILNRVESLLKQHGIALLILAILASSCYEAAVLADDYARLPHGRGFRNVRDYGAKGDGINDDTQAFIRALEEGRGRQGHKTPANVYVPPGTYLVSDTLIVWRATLLAGDSDNPPTLILKDGAPGFGDPANPKPMLVTAGGYNADPAARDWKTRTDQLGGSTNNTFFITLRNLKIKIGDRNPGAWGIYWLVAQQTSLRHVTIDAGTAQGCLKSIWWGGGGVISHLRLIGGDYGWYADQTSQWVLRSARFERQRKHSLWLHGVWNFSLLGLELKDTAPVATIGGAVSLLDSSLENIAGGTAIRNSGTSLVLQGVSSRGNKEIVQGMLSAKPRGETTIGFWVSGSAMVNGCDLPGAGHDLTEVLPAISKRLPSPDYPALTTAARSVTEFGAKGDGRVDDTSALQRAIDACEELFIPEGTYLISDTLRLRPRSRVFGEMWSQLVLKAGSPGFRDPGGHKSMIGIPESPKATTTICHLQFRMDTPGGIYCDWRAGEHSMLIDTTFANESRSQTLNWQISGSGGGFFENGWHPGASGDGLEITSSGRKWLYAVAQEHYHGTALVLRAAKHLVALGLQFEESSRYVLLDQCEDIYLDQTIAGNWQRQVPSLIHVAGGKEILLVNSAVCQADAVITQQPAGWNVGPRSGDRGFARKAAWFAGNPRRTFENSVTEGLYGGHPRRQPCAIMSDSAKFREELLMFLAECRCTERNPP
jgi:hypothetical protein